jgi:hypothetical protein
LPHSLWADRLFPFAGISWQMKIIFLCLSRHSLGDGGSFIIYHLTFIIAHFLDPLAEPAITRT